VLWRSPNQAVLLLAAATVALFGYPTVLYWLGAFLTVEQPLEAADAIVVLAGGFPTNESEGARVYHAGLSSRVIIVKEWLEERDAVVFNYGPDVALTWQRRRELLVQLGVPSGAIEVADRPACATIDELQIAAQVIGPHHGPVILVTSKAHSRRAGLVWSYVTGGQSRAIVRTATEDPFSPEGWWEDHRKAREVGQQYFGLVTLPFPLPRCRIVEALFRDLRDSRD
jgi:uncharacterized SAM-binding protein YcdF (DUF218 family)